MAIVKSIPAQRLINGKILETSEVSIVSESEYRTTGEDCVVVPSIPTEEARNKFPKGITEIRPYLRLTPQPNL